MNPRLSAGVMLLGLLCASGCGLADDLETQPPSPMTQGYLDSMQQPMNGNGQCCLGWCHQNATYYHYGSKDVTQNCTSWMQLVCSHRGLAFTDAYWGNCNEAYVYWL